MTAPATQNRAGRPKSDNANAAPNAPSPAALPTLLSVVFLNLLGFGMVIPLLPFYAQSFHAEPWQMSLIFSAYAMGGFIGEPYWGRLSDRIGRRPVLISTLAANCLCYVCMAFAPSIWAAFVIRFLGGMFAGNASVVQGYIADVTPPDQRAGKLSRIGFAFNIGFIVGPSLSGLLANPAAGPAGFRLPFLVAGVLGGCAALGVFLLVKESRARNNEMHRQPSRWAMFGKATRHSVVGPLLLLTLMAGCAFNGIESTFGFWGEHRFSWGPRETGLVFGVVGVTNAIAQWFFTGPLSQRFGEARMLAAGMALTVLATFLIPFSKGLLSATVFMSLMAFGQSVAFPNVSALISRVSDPDRQGQALGLNNATNALARFIGPLAAGLSFKAVSVAAPFFGGAALVAPAILLALAAGRAAPRAPILGGEPGEGERNPVIV
jgi:DHA1 family tetracycline resistance protein-like MFS transporter